MAVGTSIESADRVDVVIKSIAKGEVFVDVQAGRKHVALSGTNAQTPPEQFTLSSCTCLKFYCACTRQINKQYVWNDGCSSAYINPVIGVEVKVPVQATLGRRGL